MIILNFARISRKMLPSGKLWPPDSLFFIVLSGSFVFTLVEPKDRDPLSGAASACQSRQGGKRRYRYIDLVSSRMTQAKIASAGSEVIQGKQVQKDNFDRTRSLMYMPALLLRNHRAIL